jgi:hypothetical protein
VVSSPPWRPVRVPRPESDDGDGRPFGLRGSVADGARSVHDNGDLVVVFVGFVVDGGEGLEELLNDVGEDRGFPCRDAVLGEEDEEFGEGGLHVHGGIELSEVAEENRSEIDRVGIVRAEGGMFLAEGGGVGSDGQAALMTVEVAEGTAGGGFFAR